MSKQLVAQVARIALFAAAVSCTVFALGEAGEPSYLALLPGPISVFAAYQLARHGAVEA